MSESRRRARPSASRTTRAYHQHPQALVEPGAVIGARTRVWAFAHILPHAIVGEDCNICDHVLIEGGSSIGNHVTVKSGVYVWDGVHVEDRVFLGPNCTFTNHLVPRSYPKRPKTEWLEETHLRQGCSIGANATIVCGVTVGRFAFVGAGAVVTADVPDHAVVFGVPARPRGWLCECGERLRVARAKATCPQCGLSYRKTAAGLVRVR